MSTNGSQGHGMLPTGSRASKSPLSTLVRLYQTDLTCRGMADFAVIGAVVMMFLSPPHRVQWPWSDGGRSVPGISGGQGNSTAGSGTTTSGGAAPLVGPIAAGPVLTIPYPESLKSP